MCGRVDEDCLETPGFAICIALIDGGRSRSASMVVAYTNSKHVRAAGERSTAMLSTLINCRMQAYAPHPRYNDHLASLRKAYWVLKSRMATWPR